mmetsp:Transcript_10518/g.7855  ORF Transcript_10518/g.7855 Transcript_10518/m.7855 type:complete len:130 (+) Transcript_10518:91-480(+)
MKNLLDYINDSGELEKYWSIVERKNDDARRAARRLEKDRKRVEMGSDYESSEGEEEEADYYDSEEEEEESADKEDDDWDADSSKHADEYSVRKSVDMEKVKILAAKDLPFNAVRHLGMELKKLARERKS